MSKTFTWVIMGFVSAALAGCTLRIMDFTALSSKNVNVQGTRGERVTGKDMKWSILGIPTGRPDLKEALDRAIERGDGDMLVDGVVYHKAWSALIIGQMGYVIEGTVINTRR